MEFLFQYSKKDSKQKMDSSHKSNFKGDMTDGEHQFDNVHPPPYPSPYPSPMAYPVPVPVPVPAQYEPGIQDFLLQDIINTTLAHSL